MARDGAPRGPYVTGDASRERILDAAATAFSTHGYRGASLAQIAGAAGLTQQGVLYHFGNKVGLLRAVLSDRDDRGLGGWPTGRRIVGLGVLDMWDATIEENVKNYGLIRFSHVLGAEATDPAHPAHDVFVDHFEIGTEMLVAALHSGIEAGEIRADLDCVLVARQIIAMSEGLENQWLIDPDGIDIVACFHDFTRMLRLWISRPAGD
jgi:AcrR family transcriptional regulator